MAVCVGLIEAEVASNSSLDCWGNVALVCISREIDRSILHHPIGFHVVQDTQCQVTASDNTRLQFPSALLLRPKWNEHHPRSSAETRCGCTRPIASILACIPGGAMARSSVATEHSLPTNAHDEACTMIGPAWVSFWLSRLRLSSC